MMSETEKFCLGLKEINPFVKIERTLSPDGRSSSSKRIEFLKFKRNNKEIELNFEMLKDILGVLRSRRIVVGFCIEEISKDCDNKEITSPQEAKEKTEKTSPIHPNFLCYCEYFIFGIKSCLDSMTMLINHLESLGMYEKSRSIGSLYYSYILKGKFGGSYAEFISNSFSSWIEKFNTVRNEMTHKGIIGIPSSLRWTKKDAKMKYYKRQISIETDEGGKIAEPLPDYFNEIIKKYDDFSEEFFKWLNSFTLTGEKQTLNTN